MTARLSAGMRVFVACVLALGMLALPASYAIAAGHGNGAHAQPAKTSGKGTGKGKKHKKKKPPATVIVKCASVTVTCKGTPGPQGPAGAPGANGTSGTNGSAVVLRARFSGSVTAGPEKAPPGCMSISCIEGTNIPISPSTWTEGPNEDDQLIGTLTYTVPDSTECGVENSKKEFEKEEAFVLVSVGNTIEGATETETGKSPKTVTASLFRSFFMLELEAESIESEDSIEVGTGFFIGDGSPQTRTIDLTAIDSCHVKHATVSNVAIDVLASS